MVIALTDRNPIFLKAAYPAPVTLVNTLEEIPGGTPFIRWENGFLVYRMTRTRRCIPLGRFTNIHEAIFNCRRNI